MVHGICGDNDNILPGPNITHLHKKKDLQCGFGQGFYFYFALIIQ